MTDTELKPLPERIYVKEAVNHPAGVTVGNFSTDKSFGTEYTRAQTTVSVEQNDLAEARKTAVQNCDVCSGRGWTRCHDMMCHCVTDAHTCTACRGTGKTIRAALSQPDMTQLLIKDVENITKYMNHAEKLAEACRDLIKCIDGNRGHGAAAANCSSAIEILAAYEASRKGV